MCFWMKPIIEKDMKLKLINKSRSSLFGSFHNYFISETNTIFCQ